MNQATFEQEMSLNRQAYEKHREQIRRDYGDKYVAIANGRLIAVSADFETVKGAVLQLRPAPEHYLLFRADEEPELEPYDSFFHKL